MPNILVVEDEAHILRIMCIWLERHGHKVFEATNGSVAMEILDRQEIDLIISDVNMPRMDGLELLRVLWTQRKMDTPVLLLSARCDQDKLSEHIEPFNARLFPKPFVPSRLVAEVERLLSIVGGREA